MEGSNSIQEVTTKKEEEHSKNDGASTPENSDFFLLKIQYNHVPVLIPSGLYCEMYEASHHLDGLLH